MGLFVPNPRFAAELKSQDGIKQSLADQAEAVRARTEPTVPRILPSGPKALEVQTDEDGVRVVNMDHGGHIAEFGSVKFAARAPLRRGVQAAGMRLAEEPKP